MEPFEQPGSAPGNHLDSLGGYRKACGQPSSGQIPVWTAWEAAGGSGALGDPLDSPLHQSAKVARETGKRHGKTSWTAREVPGPPGPFGQPARHQGGRKGPNGQPGRHQGGTREAEKDETDSLEIG